LKDVGCWSSTCHHTRRISIRSKWPSRNWKHTFEGSVPGPLIRCSMHWPRSATCSHHKNAGTTFARQAMDQV